MASKVQYRPTAEQAPWYTTAKPSTWNTPDWPINYKVPNFGVDKDILATQKHISAAEKDLKHTMQATFEAPPSHPMDYRVPDFGKDRDLIINDINLEQAERQHGHRLQASFEKPPGHPVDYKVPDFGVDKDILATHKHLRDAEQALGQKLKGDFFDPAGPTYPVDYRVPDFGMDHEILTTQKNLKNTEKTLNHNWNPKKEGDAYVVPTAVNLQTGADIQSDPICSSAGCDQYLHPALPDSHPVDYPVPDFGVDHGILDVHASIAQAEKQLNHKWVPEPKVPDAPPPAIVHRGPDPDIIGTQESIATSEVATGHSWDPKQDANGVWLMPEAAEAGSYSYHDRDVYLQTDVESDPICSSAGCDQYLHPAPPADPPRDYPVPNFGKDPDMVGTANSISIGEAMYKHKLVMGTPES